MKRANAIGYAVLAFLLSVAAATAGAETTGMPPVEAESLARLMASPRHGEWVTVDAAGGDKVDTWVVYPERSDKAPVVIVIHEIFGLTDWVRAVTDQLAAEGFIALAPDFLSGKAPGGKGSASVSADAARSLIAALKTDEIERRLDAVERYATGLPAARREFAVVGYCWGGGISFSYAGHRPDLGAAVVYYGTSPASDVLGMIRAPVLGLYGGADARVNATVPAAEAELKRLGRSFQAETYPGAGHAFLRQQAGNNGANLEAARKAWPRMVEFLKASLGDKAAAVLPGAAVSGVGFVDCHDEEPVDGKIQAAVALGNHGHE